MSSDEGGRRLRAAEAEAAALRARLVDADRRCAADHRGWAESRKSICEQSDRYKAERDEALAGNYDLAHRVFRAEVDLSNARAEIGRLKAEAERVGQALQRHEDWCCAKGCYDPGSCIGCIGTEDDCNCIVSRIRDLLAGA